MNLQSGKNSVHFISKTMGGDLRMAGNLYVPENFDANQQYPTVVLTGAFNQVKEQTCAVYARKLAAKGYVALAFDHQGYGDSEGAIRSYEYFPAKVEGIQDAVSYLRTLSFVDADKLYGLGVCAGAAHMAYAALTDQEYSHNHDAFSKDIIVSQLNTLLTYAERFYQRQFQQRMEVMQSQTTSFFEQFKSALKDTPADRIPTVDSIANQLNMTPRYLSDALKVETGKTALENIHGYQIDKAKNLLLGSDDTVATIAHSLGFEYPQYFSRLFKSKVGMTPSQFRNYKMN